VNNNRTGLDVITFDFLERDLKYLGEKCRFNYKNVIDNVRILDFSINDETFKIICYSDSVKKNF